MEVLQEATRLRHHLLNQAIGQAVLHQEAVVVALEAADRVPEVVDLLTQGAQEVVVAQVVVEVVPVHHHLVEDKLTPLKFHNN